MSGGQKRDSLKPVGWNIPREERERRNGHKAAVLWFTGLSGAGKTTLATRLEKRLFRQGASTVLLDGDHVRQGLCRDLGFSEKDRQENIRRAGEAARLFFEAGHIVLCTFISPFARDRRFVRSLFPEGRFFEIYVRCRIETCMKRDPHGLYARALSGEIPEFTGLTSPYEEPSAPEFIAETESVSPAGIEEALFSLLGRWLGEAWKDREEATGKVVKE